MSDTTALEREFDVELRRRQAEVIDHLQRHKPELIRHQIHPGGFALPLRPLLFSAARLRRLQRSVEVFWGALLKVFFLEYGGDVRRIAGFLKLDDAALECLQRCFTPERAVTELFGRSDGFDSADRVVFIEQNITSGPGGLPGVDALSRVFDDFPPLVALRDRAGIERLSPLDSYAALFTSPAYAQTTVGYLDAILPDGSLWDDEGVRFLAAMANRGVRLVNLTDRELMLRDDGLYADGIKIERVYRGCAALALWARGDALAPLYQACERGQVRMTISPYEMVFFDKLLLPYLSDPELSPWLTNAERQVLAECLPWTRFLRDQDSSYRGQKVHLPSLLLDQRDQFVIKKGNGFGSQDVVIGAECDD
ncbi:MAG: hypothetical protein ACRDT8_22380, partial [Micromonosporaceae bacterium]